MAKVRVYELARKHNINSKEILQILIDGGVKDKNHMSALEDNTVRFIENRLRERMGIKVKPPEKAREHEAQKSKDKRLFEARPAAAKAALPGVNRGSQEAAFARRAEAAVRAPGIQPFGPRPGAGPERRPGGPAPLRGQAQPHPFVARGGERPHGMRTLSAQKIAAMTSGAARVPTPPKRQEPIQPPPQAPAPHVAPVPSASPPGSVPPVVTLAAVPPGVPVAAGAAVRPMAPLAPPAGGSQESARLAPSGPAEQRQRPVEASRPRPEARVESRPRRPETAPGGDARDLAAARQQPAQHVPVVRLPGRPAPIPAEPQRVGQVDRRERAPRPVGPGPVAAPGARGAGRAQEVHRRRDREGLPRPAASAGTAAGAGLAPAARRPGTGRYTGMAAKLELRPRTGAAVQPGQRPVPARLAQPRPVGAPAREAKAEPQRRVMELPDRLTVGALAEKVSAGVSDVIKKLMSLGLMVTVNQQIDFDTAAVVADDMGYEPRRESEREAKEFGIVEERDSVESLLPRPPVVTIMGHVDHGKTSLLDAIRSTNVTAQEAGGITQHIGAYQVELHGRKITFLDTPGHEAFTAMRARGAQVTDVAVLVVAADDGVMPQTIEAINHAKAAAVPIVVAINKIDKSNAQPDRVKQQLSEHGLVAEDWGGDVVMVPVSALRKQGIENVLEMILIVADMRELKANPSRPARGTVIEARLDKGRGPVATVLVQKGTLRLGDSIVAGATSGRVRAMTNDKGQAVETAGPSMPVEVLGLSDVPKAGETMQVVLEDRVARQLAVQREEHRREEGLTKLKKVSLDDLFKQIKEGEVKDLNVIIKADVQGSAEAIRQSFEDLSTPDVRVNVIHSGVGSINKTDVMLAATSGAVIVGFQVRPEPVAKKMAEQESVDVRLYDVIYDAIDNLRAAMKGMLAPQLKEVTLGRAEVRQTFRVPKVGVVAGAYVSEGKIVRGADARVLRDNVAVYSGKIESLRRFKDDVKEVAEGFECGIGIEKFNDIKEGDIVEAYAMEEQPKEA